MSCRLVVQPRLGLTAARELAAESAAGEVIVFIDDDNLLGPDYLEIVTEDFDADPALGALGGSVIPQYSIPLPGWLGRDESHLAVRRLPSGFWSATSRPPYSDAFPIGAGMAVRTGLARAWAESLHGDVRIEGRQGSRLFSGEDVDLDLFVLSEGFVVAVDARLVVTHVIDESRLSRRYLERLVRDGTRSTAQIETKWGPRFGVPISPDFYRRDPALLLRALLCWALGFMSPRYRLRWIYYREVLAAIAKSFAASKPISRQRDTSMAVDPARTHSQSPGA